METSSDDFSDEYGCDPSETMMDYIALNMEASVFPKTRSKFLPERLIEDIFSLDLPGAKSTQNAQERVLWILETQTKGDREIALAEFIVRQARRIFLICIYCRLSAKELIQAMSMFMDFAFDDNSLPITSEDITPAETVSRIKDGRHPFHIMEPNPKITQVKHRRRFWTSYRIHSFTESQWKFLAPILSQSVLVHDVGRHILPFVRGPNSTRASEGTFGSVTCFEVHRDHLRDSGEQKSPSGCIIAVKEFKKDRKTIVKQWENEVRVLEKMNTLRHNHIARFVTAFRYGEGPDLDHFICFEWADGGNLADMWSEDPQPLFVEGNPLLKVSDGESSEESFIHGDIKPKNILWFKKGGAIGTLKLADWGQAGEYDGANTATRHNTTGRYGTRRYEPPEIETGIPIDAFGSTKRVRSRLYDVWSFGCFSLEFIIWLLHGTNGLERFRRNNIGDYGLSDSFYDISHGRIVKVHGVVSHWMDHLEKNAICQKETSALGDLLDIVRNGLLVVKLPQGGGNANTRVKTYSRFLRQNDQKQNETKSDIGSDVPDTTYHLSTDGEDKVLDIHLSNDIENLDLNKEGLLAEYECGDGTMRSENANSAPPVVEIERFRAVELVENLNRIAEIGESDSYWFQDLPRCSIPPSFRDRAAHASLRIPIHMRGNYQCPDLDPEDWRTGLDNKFAATTFERLANVVQSSPPHSSEVTQRLCDECQDFRKEIWSPFFSKTYETRLLSQNVRSCDLCALLWHVCQDDASARHSKVRFERRGSAIKINDRTLPALSLFRQYNARSAVPDIQTGFSELPNPGTLLHLELLKSWLDHCDSEHWKNPRCKPSRFKRSAAGSVLQLPTRLIAVGTNTENTVKLQEMEGLDVGDWVALSYRWGPPPHFSTTQRNLNEMYDGIDVGKLPKTFIDAIAITRALGIPYLWIDSICIIQDHDGDFKNEATKMKDVYNGAYCVLAACCATDQRSGFLSPRWARRQVTLDSQHLDYGAIHVCETIDNFEHHVLKGGLARRGWVLQEHALARRTIFFTEYQTYWECGHGIRCETMSTLTNEHASLLGDPNFPKLLEPAEHGEVVMRLQELLKQYSRLGLSRDYDRSTAIASLQKRLITVMNLQGDYGIFESNDNPGLLRRSLLWYRPLDVKSLATINYPKSQEVPSWSWMSCSGPIDYFPLTFDGFEWQALDSTWSTGRRSWQWSWA
ncbi:hypothetical protein C7974DRAFT_474313 [Boeremia exigua]|uniref:uncharacterized protein n=1 Tax=Boeremia exigua TaxID=749465 RepID=UPI001E8EAF37|nr:uncharacterized protein C7974DRAFT_474313 [Boeremia exigua]KAH6618463.1 hypothetical protein C7974DRAFT_474313 [Boeremia exigua]